MMGELNGLLLSRKRVESDTSVKISLPIEECYEMTHECLKLLTSLLELGITQVSVTDTAEKVNN
jgi:hypothetical protein